MFSDLFKTPTIVARYQTSPYAESRDQFLRKTRDDGKSPSTIRYIAWALRVVAETVDLGAGTITVEELEDALSRRIEAAPLPTLAKHYRAPSSPRRLAPPGCAYVPKSSCRTHNSVWHSHVGRKVHRKAACIGAVIRGQANQSACG